MERYGNILANKEDHQDQPWKYNPRRGVVGLYSSSTTGVIGGFSWPPRSYGCSFCKREFRSAQALGGHMNVHRRERARLRQYSPPWDTPSPPNPNPNHDNNPNMIINNRNKTSVPNLNVAPVPALSVIPPPCSPPSPSSTLSSAPVTKNLTGDQVKFSLFGHNYTLIKPPVSFYGREGTIRDLAVDERNAMKIELAAGRRCQDRRLEDGLDLELRLGSLN